MLDFTVNGSAPPQVPAATLRREALRHDTPRFSGSKKRSSPHVSPAGSSVALALGSPPPLPAPPSVDRIQADDVPVVTADAAIRALRLAQATDGGLFYQAFAAHCRRRPAEDLLELGELRGFLRAALRLTLSEPEFDKLVCALPFAATFAARAPALYKGNLGLSHARLLKFLGALPPPSALPSTPPRPASPPHGATRRVSAAPSPEPQDEPEAPRVLTLASPSHPRSLPRPAAPAHLERPGGLGATSPDAQLADLVGSLAVSSRDALQSRLSRPKQSVTTGLLSPTPPPPPRSPLPPKSPAGQTLFAHTLARQEAAAATGRPGPDTADYSSPTTVSAVSLSAGLPPRASPSPHDSSAVINRHRKFNLPLLETTPTAQAGPGVWPQGAPPPQLRGVGVVATMRAALQNTATYDAVFAACVADDPHNTSFVTRPQLRRTLEKHVGGMTDVAFAKLCHFCDASRDGDIAYDAFLFRLCDVMAGHQKAVESANAATAALGRSAFEHVQNASASLAALITSAVASVGAPVDPPVVAWAPSPAQVAAGHALFATVRAQLAPHRKAIGGACRRADANRHGVVTSTLLADICATHAGRGVVSPADTLLLAAVFPPTLLTSTSARRVLAEPHVAYEALLAACRTPAATTQAEALVTAGPPAAATAQLLKRLAVQLRPCWTAFRRALLACDPTRTGLILSRQLLSCLRQHHANVSKEDWFLLQQYLDPGVTEHVPYDVLLKQLLLA